ncbi:MAG TPA: PDZ domain-containing protein [Chloroflexota bacterium]|nr:PDZ domain-containing protein [Chloroflexota bacterium]
MAKEFLSQKGVPFVEKDVSRDRAAAQELLQMGQRGVPVIKVDGQVMVGFNRARLEQLLAHSPQRAERPKLGASVADAARHVANTTGAYVGRVRDGSTAARAGLRAGDVITMLAGQAVQNADDVERAMTRVQSRARVPARVRRDGRSVELTLEF